MERNKKILVCGKKGCMWIANSPTKCWNCETNMCFGCLCQFPCKKNSNQMAHKYYIYVMNYSYLFCNNDICNIIFLILKLYEWCWRLSKTHEWGQIQKKLGGDMRKCASQKGKFKTLDFGSTSWTKRIILIKE